LRALNAAGIDVLIIKGARHLVVDDGAWTMARGMRDLDLVVHAPQSDAALACLHGLGYRSSGPSGTQDHHLPYLRIEDRHGSVELHCEALAYNARGLLSTEDAWRWSQLRDADGSRFRVLPAEWHLLHGLLHHQVSDRGHPRRVLALKGLWEFAMLGNALAPAA